MTGLLRSKLGQQHEHLALYLLRRQSLLLQFLRQGLHVGPGSGSLHFLLVPLGFFFAVEDALHRQVGLFKGHFEQTAFVDVR